MKSLLISLLLIISTNVKANESQELQEIRYGGDAPVFANLTIEGVTRNMTTVNPRFSLVSNANLTLNKKSLSLVLNRRMPPCPLNRICPMMMPAPVQINLTVYKVEKTACSVKYTAATAANVKSTISEQVVVEDFTNSTCPVPLQLPYKAGDVTYTVKGISSLSKQPETATATFTVVNFIRAQN